MKSLLFLLSLINIFQVRKTNEEKYLYRCGVDEKNIIPIPATNFINIIKNKRQLKEEKFKDFNIYLDLINIKMDIKKFKLEKYENLFIDSLNKGVETLKSLLKVKRVNSEFMFTDKNITDIGIVDWNKTLLGDKAIDSLQKLGIDLIIFGKFDDQMDNFTLANAGSRYVDPESGQPLVGIININTKVNFSKIHSKEYFQLIVFHEFTHILGFTRTHFIQYMHNTFSRKDKYGIDRTYVNSTKVIEVAKKYYNCPTIDGVELENFGGNGTSGSHWEARILLGEYMNGVLYPEEQVISEFTLALLEDTGYYKANYYTGGLMRYGKGKGCDFINNKCVNSTHEINPLFENEFYDSIYSEYSLDASCSSGRQSRTYYAWWKYENIPQEYQYFTNKKYGGFSAADYCPVAKEYSKESDNAYYTGHCSLKGNGGYGTQINYEEIKGNSKTVKSYTSNDLELITGETYSDHSFCYQSSLIKNSSTFDNSVVRAVCYETFCSDKSLTIKINNDYFVCPRPGGKIKVEGYKGYFMCPDYNLMCSGTVLCNDIFDCVEKKSETKEESYYNDYTMKTTQNIEVIEIMSFDETNNYELSENGKCSINCQHCDIYQKCLNCRNDYGLIISDITDELVCVSKTQLNKGYYINNNIYYKCMERCEKCSDSITCDECIEGYDFGNKKCVGKINNCKIYGNDDLCDECKDNYVIKGNNRTICLKIRALFILQVQIINNKLKIFFIVNEKIEEDIEIKISIEIYKNKNNIRNIEESNYENKIITMIINNNIEPGHINELTSEEEFDDSDRIIVRPISEKNSLYEILTLNNDNKVLDTEENKKMVENGNIIDFSKVDISKYEVSKYIINSVSKGCEFNLESKNAIKENNESIILNFIEKDNINNNININCTLSKNNGNKIPCSLEQEINNNYTLESYIGSNKERIFYIIQENENDLELYCKTEEKEKEKKSNNKIIIIIVCIVVVLIIIAIVIIIIYCKTKQKDETKVTTEKKAETPDRGQSKENEDNMSMSFSDPREKY